MKAPTILGTQSNLISKIPGYLQQYSQYQSPSSQQNTFSINPNNNLFITSYTNIVLNILQSMLIKENFYLLEIQIIGGNISEQFILYYNTTICQNQFIINNYWGFITLNPNKLGYIEIYSTNGNLLIASQIKKFN
jgi:hypothetical protein